MTTFGFYCYCLLCLLHVYYIVLSFVFGLMPSDFHANNSMIVITIGTFSYPTKNIYLLTTVDKGLTQKQNIRKTCPCYVYPLEPHFYIAKLGYAGVYPFLAHLSRRLTGELIVYPCSVVRPSSVCPSSVVHNFKEIFSSETAGPIKAKLHVEHP